MSDGRALAGLIRSAVNEHTVNAAVSTDETLELADVWRRRVGAELAADVDAVVVIIPVDDPVPFADGPTQGVITDGDVSETFDITSVDEDACTLTVVRDAGAAWSAGAEVYVLPESEQTFVDAWYCDDTGEADGVLEAIPIAAAVAARLVLGTRERGYGERVIARKLNASGAAHDWLVEAFADTAQRPLINPSIRDEWDETSPVEDAIASVGVAQQAAEDAAQVAADAAQAAAAANASIADIFADDTLVPPEKQVLRGQWDALRIEHPQLDAQADAYGAIAAIDTEQGNLDYYYVGLGTRLNNNVTWAIGGATPTLITTLTTTTVLAAGGGGSLRNWFNYYYTGRVALLKAIADQAKVLSDASTAAAAASLAAAAAAQEDATAAGTAAATAQAAASTFNAAVALADAAATHVFNAQPTTPYTVGNTWHEGGTVHICIVARATGAFVAADWTNFSLFAMYVAVGALLTSPAIVGADITGGTFRTAPAGQAGIVMTGNGAGGWSPLHILFNSGAAAEVAPGFIQTAIQDVGTSYQRPKIALVTSSFFYGSSTQDNSAFLTLRGRSVDGAMLSGESYTVLPTISGYQRKMGYLIYPEAGVMHHGLYFGPNGVESGAGGVILQAHSAGDRLYVKNGGNTGYGTLTAIIVNASATALKTNIAEVTDAALPQVLAAKPRRYHMAADLLEQKDPDGKVARKARKAKDVPKHLGLLLEELPAEVANDEGYEVGGVLALLFGAVQELTARVSALEALLPAQSG